jgi:drug/metabolite transporter (DMT)-like permease
MKIPVRARNILQINIAMLFISTSGVLGRWLTLSPPETIFYRAFLATIILGVFCKFKQYSFVLAKKSRVAIFFGGLFLGIHWVTFFYALQLSNVAIGMIAIFTYPVITTLIEPLLLKVPFQKEHLLLALLVLLGICFLVPEFSLENKHTEAVVWGITSAFFYALRNVIMKKQIVNYHGSVLMYYQILVVTVCLLPVLWFSTIDQLIVQWPGLLTLALLTTAIGHTLFLMSFKQLSISSASILSGVQPIYGIILGIIFLKEFPASNTIIGGVLIIIAVCIESFRATKNH